MRGRGRRRAARLVVRLLGVTAVLSVVLALVPAAGPVDEAAAPRVADRARFPDPIHLGGRFAAPDPPRAAATQEGVAAGDAPIVPPAGGFDAPASPTEAPPPELATAAGVAPEGGLWAVVVGIDDYPGRRHDLRSAVNDADDLDRALAGFGVPAHRRLVLRDRQASADAIRGALAWLVAHAGPDATAVLYYAGHVRKAGGGEAIVGADGALLGDRELAARLQGLRARRAWLVFAACYGLGFDEALAPGRVLTAAATANQLAYENTAYGRSYLGQVLVREAMLERRAPASVQDAYAYARAELAERHPDRQVYQVDRLGEPLRLTVGGAPPAARSERGAHEDASPESDEAGSGERRRPAPAPAPGGGGHDGDEGDDPGDDDCADLTLGVVRCRDG